MRKEAAKNPTVTLWMTSALHCIQCELYLSFVCMRQWGEKFSLGDCIVDEINDQTQSINTNSELYLPEVKTPRIRSVQSKSWKSNIALYTI